MNKLLLFVADQTNRSPLGKLLSCQLCKGQLHQIVNNLAIYFEISAKYGSENDM